MEYATCCWGFRRKTHSGWVSKIICFIIPQLQRLFRHSFTGCVWREILFYRCLTWINMGATIVAVSWQILLWVNCLKIIPLISLKENHWTKLRKKILHFIYLMISLSFFSSQMEDFSKAHSSNSWECGTLQFSVLSSSRSP